MRYRLTTSIKGHYVAVECGEGTARILLPLWSKEEPNFTSCSELTGLKRVIAAFNPEDGECDCCSEWRPLTQTWTTTGGETWACAKCRGVDEDEE